MSGERFYIGHSRGGAVAYLAAYSRLKRSLRVDGVYAWAPARPGNHVIGETFTASNLAVRALRNIADPIDPVPETPLNLPLVNEEYNEPVPFETFSEPSTPPDDWGPLSSHHFELYQAGCKSLDQGTWALPLNQACDLCAQLYADPVNGWDVVIPIDGSRWAVQFLPNDVKVAISRGSQTGRDWIDNFKAWQIDRLGARVSAGFWVGLSPVESELDEAMK